MAEKGKKEKEKKGGVPIIVVIILALVIILGGAFSAYMLLFNKGTGKTSSNTTNTVSDTPIQEATLTLDETIINLADTDTQRYAKVKVSFGYDSTNTKLAAEVTSTDVDKKPIFNDAIIKIISSKKASELSGKGIDDVKKQILDAVNQHLEKGKFTNVYFNELVIQ